MTADPIGDALRADADAARAEIRAAGIVCPSCGVNMADVPKDHLMPYDGLTAKTPFAMCNYGQSIPLAASSPMSDADFATWQAAVNVALMDDFRKREAEAFGKIIGKREPGHEYTGLLDILGAQQ